MSEAKKVLEQAIERWNATDRDGWAALYTDDVVFEVPGGARISGLADLKEKSDAMRGQWEREKEAVAGLRDIKEKIEQTRLDIEEVRLSRRERAD